MEDKDQVVLVIGSEEDAFHYLKLASNGEFAGRDVSFEFNNWPRLDINIKGGRYNSTLPTGVMKGLIEYQGVLNRAFALLGDHPTAKSISESERQNLEVVFEVSEGSSDISSLIPDQLWTIAEQAMLTMSGTELVIAVLGVALIIGLTKLGLSKLKCNAELASEKLKYDFAKDIVEQNVKLSQVNSDLNKAMLTVVKGAHDANFMRIGGITLDGAEIESLTKRKRSSTEKRRIDDLFLVKKLQTTDTKWKILFQHDAYGFIKVDLYKTQEADRVFDDIQDAFRNSRAVSLYMLGAFKGDNLVSATIVGSPTFGLLFQDENY
ncbi:hypothetical protein [Pseudomonas kilonensis]|uniref:Uncharacterized protein n=1 Tax=Pseudomonas kilonensis TaxID=132476 RepID=A0ABY0ZJH1_9PSED|nr:hypothetical protein [Pseudomonas kilonensis]SEE81757.1 hypothetical protein SAMN04490188_5907 [Pseudomonas kilonensis]